MIPSESGSTSNIRCENAVWFKSGLQPGKTHIQWHRLAFCGSFHLSFGKKQLDWLNQDKYCPYLKKDMSVGMPGITRLHMTTRDWNHSGLSLALPIMEPSLFKRDAYCQWWSHKSRKTERLHIKPAFLPFMHIVKIYILIFSFFPS